MKNETIQKIREAMAAIEAIPTEDLGDRVIDLRDVYNDLREMIEELEVA